MPTANVLKVGIVGARRGRSFQAGLEACGARIAALCDINADVLAESARLFGVAQTFTDYDAMLDQAALDAVVIGTPMPLHAPQAIAALDRGLHVLSEVTASVSIEESHALVSAATRSPAVYMMAENYVYMRPNVIIGEMVRQGEFGTPYYAEGEYLHELKELNETTPWRRTWQTGIEGITYGSHSLGPILMWLGDDRVCAVSCVANARPLHQDPRGKPYHAESPVMLCRTAKAVLIKIRVDMVSDRPHAMANYQLQGTDGAYESARGGPGETNKVWLRGLSQASAWVDLDGLMRVDAMRARFEPEIWRNPPPEARRAGHGGGDFFEILDWVNAIRGDAPCPIDIHKAMDMTLPGLVSQQSILQEGAWLDVPNSREWVR